jgi:hypothetical protein
MVASIFNRITGILAFIFITMIIRSPIMMFMVGLLSGIFMSKLKPEMADKIYLSVMNWITVATDSLVKSGINL